MLPFKPKPKLVTTYNSCIHMLIPFTSIRIYNVLWFAKKQDIKKWAIATMWLKNICIYFATKESKNSLQEGSSRICDFTSHRSWQQLITRCTSKETAKMMTTYLNICRKWERKLIKKYTFVSSKKWSICCCFRVLLELKNHVCIQVRKVNLYEINVQNDVVLSNPITEGPLILSRFGPFSWGIGSWFKS